MTAAPKGPQFGNKAGYFIFRWVIKLFGVRPAYFALRFVIAYYVLCRPRARRAAGPYLARRFPETGRLKRLGLTYKYYYHFGMGLIDQAAMGILGLERTRIDFPEADELRALAAEGRGLVFITSHIGVWQQAISTLGFMGRSVYLNIRREMHSQTMGLADFEGSGVEVHVVSPDGFLGGIPELGQALTHGHIVAVMGDRGYGAAACQSVDFLGKPADFPLLPYHLALTTGSDLLVFLTSRLGPQHFLLRAVIRKMSPDIQALDKAAARSLLLKWYVDALENHLKKYPLMWYNFVDFWDKTRDEADE